MTKKERIEFYSFSLQDFMKKFNKNNYTDPAIALKDTMKYIARFNLNPEYTKSSFEEVIFAARNEIIKMVAKKQISENINDIKNIKSSDDNMVKAFIAEPIKTTSYYLEKNNKMFDEIVDRPIDEANYKLFLSYNANSISINLKNPMYQINYNKYVKENSKASYLCNQLISNLSDSKNPIDRELKRQKPNFFENLLGKTSNEYIAFKNGFKHYTNPESPLFGDDDTLKELAKNYLHHKFPNLKDGELPTIDEINALRGKGKARASFCLNICNILNEKEAMIDKLHDINTNLKFNIDKYPWEENINKESLENKLIKDEEIESNNINNDNINEYDKKYDAVEIHENQNIFN